LSHPLHIQLFILGGTIAMAGSDGAVPTLDAEALLRGVPEAVRARLQIQVRAVANVPSAGLDFHTIIGVARDIAGSRADGSVVVQGTDTMEETAFALDLMLGAQARTVVTGAMRPADRPGADGPANLTAALLTAAMPGLTGRGVVVVMNEEIHAARFVEKRHTTAPNAFVSPGHAAIGAVVEQQVKFEGLVRRPPCLGVPKTAPPPVALYEACFDEDARVLARLPDCGYRGAVVAAFGGGHLSQSQAEAAAQLSQHMPVILCSRCGAGWVLQDSYAYPGSERDLIAKGLVWGGLYRPRHARLMVALALAAGRPRDQLSDLFQN